MAESCWEHPELNVAIEVVASQKVALHVEQEEHTQAQDHDPANCDFPGLGPNRQPTVAASQRTPLHNGLIRTND